MFHSTLLIRAPGNSAIAGGVTGWTPQSEIEEEWEPGSAVKLRGLDPTGCQRDLRWEPPLWASPPPLCNPVLTAPASCAVWGFKDPVALSTDARLGIWSVHNNCDWFTHGLCLQEAYHLVGNKSKWWRAEVNAFSKIKESKIKPLKHPSTVQWSNESWQTHVTERWVDFTTTIKKIHVFWYGPSFQVYCYREKPHA